MNISFQYDNGELENTEQCQHESGKLNVGWKAPAVLERLSQDTGYEKPDHGTVAFRRKSISSCMVYNWQMMRDPAAATRLKMRE